MDQSSTKVCGECKQRKLLGCFSKNRAKFDGLQRKCNQCKASENKVRAAKRRKFIAKIKEASPCTDCGQYFPACAMDFDHVRGHKIYGISKMVCMSMKRIKAEIAKCELVCANCHRIRTHKHQKT